MGKPAYKKSYCEIVIREMNKGHSLSAVSGEIGVTRKTLYNWTKKHPEFEEAVEIGSLKAAKFWESRLINQAKYDKGNAAATIFGVKNRARIDWRDKWPDESGNDEKPQPVSVTINVKDARNDQRSADNSDGEQAAS